jgi:elongation factor Tu
MAGGVFSPPKPHLTVGTIGHIDHGKTTLTAAIVARQAHKNRAGTFKTYKEIARGGVERDELKTVTLVAAHVVYETPNRHYAHIDCPGYLDYIRSTISAMARLDGAILVVAADDGVMPVTREHLLLARQVGMPPHIVVTLTREDP